MASLEPHPRISLYTSLIHTRIHDKKTATFDTSPKVCMILFLVTIKPGQVCVHLCPEHVHVYAAPVLCCCYMRLLLTELK